jgi:citrate lyase subunit alpha/citrate CoA-transferase
MDRVMEVIEDGDVISYPHYYRLGDRGLEQVINALRKHKKRGIILYASALLDHTNPWLAEAFMEGTLAGIFGNVYRRIGQYVTAGDFLPWCTVGMSHGNRVRKLQHGEVHIKVAFGPVPYADIHGNANGLMGKSEHLCGPVGLFTADTLHADYVCLLAGTISQNLIMPSPISMEQVDFVVAVDTPGLSEGIGSGTLDLEKIRSRPFNAKIAEAVTRVMKAAGVVKDHFNFQVGSGAGLIVLDNIRQMLKKQKISANFAMGGCTSMHVDMLHEGTIKTLLHGQMFEPSPKVVDSLLKDHNHHEIAAGYYASVANKESAVNMLDVAVLSSLEVDLDFNVNTVCANGRIIGGIGGGQDVAAGSDLTIMFLPLATGKDGMGFPRVVEKVYTRTTPGEVIDVVVTEDYASLNPRSTSSYSEAIQANHTEFNINLIPMEELHARSLKKASHFGTLPVPAETTDEVVHIIEWRDGSLLDTIKKTIS